MIITKLHHRRKEIVSGGHDKENFFKRHFFLGYKINFQKSGGHMPPPPSPPSPPGSYGTELLLENARCIRSCNYDAASEPLLPKVAHCISVLSSRYIGKCAARVLQRSASTNNNLKRIECEPRILEIQSDLL